MTTRFFRGIIVSSLLAFLPFSNDAVVLDDFEDGARTGWQDFTFVPDFGLPAETAGQLHFNLPPAGQALFVASTRVSETFTLESGKTIEFRVDLLAGNGPDAFAVLAFIPASSSVDTLAGYGFAKSETDVLVTKGIQKYFLNESPDMPLKNQNVTMVLSLTGRENEVVINARLLDKDDNNAVLFSETFVDTAGAEILAEGLDDPPNPYLGPGNFALICYQDFDEAAPQTSYDVTFDNAEAFVLEEILVDDFDDNQKTGWEDFTFLPGFGLPVETGGQFEFELPPAGQALFVASTKTSPVFELKEGEKLRFQVDVIEGVGADSFAVLAFIPTSSSASSLAGYGFAQSATDILLTKGIQKYFYNEHVEPEIKNTNVTLALTLEAREGSVIINGQILDKENQNEVLFEQTFVDTPGADIFADGEDDPAAPYLGTGNFVLFCYQDYDETSPQDVYRVIYDNARSATPPLPGNTRPVISEVAPAPFANFVAVGATVSFTVRDDKALAEDGITVVLNGEEFTTANGLQVSGEENSRTVSLGGLEANVNYVVALQVTDSDGETTSMPLFFDTFLSQNLMVVVEDFNFFGGSFIDDPVLYPEASGPYFDGYVSQWGSEGIDYHDTRTSLDDVPYRPQDLVRMRRTLDHPRQKFIDAGGSAALIFDYDVGDVAAGEWMNYTRTFPAGTYEVYLRESLVNGTRIETVLEEVTSEPFFPDQLTQVLGSFLTPTTGFLYKNVPLTDALGQQKAQITLSGETTLRLSQVTGAPSDGDIFQNYLIFIPVEDSGPQRATLAAVSPVGGATVNTLTPSITATIQNRDTDVVVDTVKLYVDSQLVDATVTGTAAGAEIIWALSPLPASGSPVSARLEFEDSENVTQTNEWTFTITYLMLDPANRRSGSGLERGLNVRFVQAPLGSALGNTLARAEDQLAANTTIPAEINVTTTAPVMNFVEFPGDTRGEIPGDVLVPGLQPEFNGTDDYAVEVTAFLDLPAGIHRFGIITDDGYKIQSGASLRDLTAAPLKFVNGATANETFEFLVAVPGLYPFRMVWYERGGDSHGEWTSINRETGERILINDPDDPDAILAYLDVAAPLLQVESAATVTGGFAVDASAVVDAVAKTVTIPLGSGTRFYRLNGSMQHQLSGAQIASGNLVFRYE